MSRLRGKVRWRAMLGTVQLETIIHDNSLPAVIEERGQTWLRVRRVPRCWRARQTRSTLSGGVESRVW
jgi:hypothetical protein